MATRHPHKEFLNSSNGVTKTYQVEKPFHHNRLDIFLAKQLDEISRNRIQKIIESNGVLVNARQAKAKDLVNEGDVVIIRLPDGPKKSLVPAMELPLKIIYEDEFLIVIDKPYGLVVHPGSGSHANTLLQGLLYYASDKNFTPSLVHRLDKDTSGVLLCAKSETIHEQLALQFKNKTNLREYVAILNGMLPDSECTRRSYLKRHPISRTKFCSMEVKDYEKHYPQNSQKPKNLRFSVSHFKVLKTFRQRLSLVTVRLETGRTHQIRVHASDLNAPVLGDPLYGTASTMPTVFAKETRDRLRSLTRQMLHAQFLGFTHPISGKKIAFSSEVPEDMGKVLRELEKYID